MSIHSETRKYEVVVVGGGLAGVCAAIASARKGARTAIIQNRSMFGGNASSEIRMHIVGANSHGAKKKSWRDRNPAGDSAGKQTQKSLCIVSGI